MKEPRENKILLFFQDVDEAMDELFGAYWVMAKIILGISLVFAAFRFL